MGEPARWFELELVRRGEWLPFAIILRPIILGSIKRRNALDIFLTDCLCFVGLWEEANPLGQLARWRAEQVSHPHLILTYSSPHPHLILRILRILA